MKFKTIFIILLTVFTVQAQEFKLSADIKPRYEYRHGFSTLSPKGAIATNWVSQRTRFISDYRSAWVNARISIQNVRVWGDVPTMTRADNYIKFHEAWAEVALVKNLWLKMGRQEIVYDDHRIFGNVEWAQQARSHDAAVFKYLPNDKHRVDVGFTFNANSEENFRSYYPNTAGYKALQYLWYHGNFNNLGISFLALNTGLEFQDTTKTNPYFVDYMQTIGPRITYKKEAIEANGAFYYQMGELNKAKVNAMYAAAFASYTFKKMITIGAGMEYLSGKAMNDTTADIKSFAPLFGTNHKFNGWMDYFYVGNHAGSVGLVDIYFLLGFKKKKFSAKLIPHLFSAAADVYQGSEKKSNDLGTEIDFTFSYKLAKNVTLVGGYSKMLATESMEVLKGGSAKEDNSWAWLMFVIRPTFFKHTFAAKQE